MADRLNPAANFTSYNRPVKTEKIKNLKRDI